MKNNIYRIFTLSLIIGMTHLYSCSNRNDKIVGTWKAELSNGDNILKFYENGDYSWSRELAINPYIQGQWKIKGKSLYMKDDMEKTEQFYPTYDIVRLNDYQLFIKEPVFGEIYEFKKDSY